MEHELSVENDVEKWYPIWREAHIVHTAQVKYEDVDIP